ncbi:MAG TPA: hypothetical protein VG889_22365 [Rhizomicrobium sp.]|nr:hypothetical protein [Rhizomicrobium sp.]
MATTMYFEKEIEDVSDKKIRRSLDVEIGTSSYLGPHRLYLRVGDTAVLLGDEIGREFCESVYLAGRYLGYLKD